VSEEDVIEAGNVFEGVGAAGIGHHPGVNEGDLAGGSDERKSAVAEVGDLIAFEIEHEGPPEICGGIIARVEKMKLALRRKALRFRGRQNSVNTLLAT
jgi:hypothetical protein